MANSTTQPAKAIGFDLEHFNAEHWAYQRRYLLLGIAVLGLATMMLFLSLLPQIFGDFDAYATLNMHKATLKNLQEKQTALADSAYVNNSDSTRKVNLALPSEKPLLQLLATTNQLAQKSNITVQQIETSPGKLATASAVTVANSSAPSTIPSVQLPAALQSAQGKGTSLSNISGVATLEVAVTVQGTLGQVDQFIQDLEQTTPLIDISQIELAAQGNTSDISSGVPSQQAVVQAKLNLMTFYFTQSIQVSIDQPLPSLGPKENNFLSSLNTFIFPDFTPQQNVQGGGQKDLFGVNQ